MKRRILEGTLLIVLSGLCWWGLTFLLGVTANPLLPGLLALACGLLGLVMFWAAQTRSARIWLSTGLAILALMVFAPLLTFELNTSSAPELVALALFLYPSLLPACGFLNAAILIAVALGRRQGGSGSGATPGRERLACALLSGALLAAGFSGLYWLLVWDSTTDPLGLFWLLAPYFGALFAGGMLFALAPKKWKWTGAAYAALLVAGLLAVSRAAEAVDFRQLTENRAARITRAIEAYQSREGAYPPALNKLAPRYLISVPGPVSISGTGWCYDSDGIYYRFGYVTRDHWSDPRLLPKIVSTKGEVSGLTQICDEEINSYLRHKATPLAFPRGELSTTNAMIAGTLLGVLFVLAAAWVREKGSPETASQRMLLFYEITLIILLVALAAVQFFPSLATRNTFFVQSLFLPVIFGLVIVLLLNARLYRQLSKKGKLLAAGFGLILLVALAYHLREPGLLFEVLPPGLVLFALAWLFNGRTSRWIWVLPFASLGLLALMYSHRLDQADGLPQVLVTLRGLGYLLSPALAIGAAGLFFSTGVQLTFSPMPAQTLREQRLARVEGVFRLTATAVLVGSLVYITAWESIWDQTTDGLGGLFVQMISILSAAAGGMVIALKARRAGRLLGIGFALATAIAVNAGFDWGWQVNFPQLTENRAARITDSLEQFHTQEGQYPTNLAELSPRFMLRVPGPVMFRNEGWCYQGGGQAYRLAAFSHEYFGMPVSLHVYSSAGEVGDQPLPCQERLAEMQERYDWTRSAFETQPTFPATTPVPLPAGAESETLQPIYATPERLLNGAWSPDGKWWFFRAPIQGTRGIQFYFYDALEQKICPLDQVAEYTPYTDQPNGAWISGNRLLILDGSRDLSIFEPCGGKVGSLAAPEGLSLVTRLSSETGSGERLLFSDEQAFYLLQPGVDNLHEIEGILPVPYESYSDSAAWSPGSERLAIARLNSREPKDGITLALVDGRTGAVTTQMQLGLANKQSPPHLEWVSNDHLLLNSPNTLLMLDLTANPPRQVDVMTDLFQLGAAFPNQVHSSTSVTAQDGKTYHLAVWVNQPGNQEIYIYHSENGQVSTFQPHSLDALLVFPTGQWTRLTRLTSETPVEDSIDLYQIDSIRPTPDILRVDGHLPRGYSRLDIDYLPESARLLLASSNGVSEVSLTTGEILNFWRTGSGRDISPWINLSPDRKTALLPVEGDGLFVIPFD